MGFLVLGIIILAVLWFFGTYNSLVHLRNKSKEGWSDIDTQLKRRYDLIPNLVATVKGYAKHEGETFENVTKARNMAVDASKAGDVKGQIAAENMLSGALKSLFAVSESYPELKANENFMQLQSTLNEVEDKIQMSRRYYNGTVRDLNNKIEMVPSNIVANLANFEKRAFFEIDDSQKEAVKVDFN